MTTHRAREILAAVTRAYPDAWRQAEQFRQLRGGKLPRWPNWCYLPLAGGHEIARAGKSASPKPSMPAILCALAAWRMTMGIYRFDQTLFAALVDTPIEGDIPTGALYRLPEWCIYIETPGIPEAPQVRGAWAHMEWDANGGPDELRLLLDEDDGLRPLPIILGTGSLADACARLLGRMPESTQSLVDARNAARLFEPFISLVLYIATQANEITGNGQPGNPAPVRTRRGGMREFPADGPRVWDVGVRIGAALRAAYAAEQTQQTHPHAGPRPHIRRAHWHTFLSGPRTGEQRRDLRWLPPIAVALQPGTELPAVVRRVPPRD